VCLTDLCKRKAPLLIQSEYDIQFHLLQPTPIVALLHLHPKHDVHLTTVAGIDADDRLHVEQLGLNKEPLQDVPVDEYLDSFGNCCSRFLAPAGDLRLHGRNIVTADDFPELQGFNLPQTPVELLPAETLQFLLASRYCEVDLFGSIAHDLFGHLGSGWALAATIRDWVHSKVAFDYKKARPTMTAMDVFSERIGVCRDFQHLAVTLTRCMKIPARYVTGYIGDIRVPFSGDGDFSAWYQIWLDGRWWDMDARHNYPRTGRILMATGRDAADVAITTSFGRADLTHFYVDSFEIDAHGNRVPLVPKLDAPIPAPPTT
jgi:transglutaminase-like putative cysteine protease